MSISEEIFSLVLQEKLLVKILFESVKHSRVSSINHILHTAISQLNPLPNERPVLFVILKKLLYNKLNYIKGKLPNTIDVDKKILKWFEYKQKEFFDFDYNFENICYDIISKQVDEQEIESKEDLNKIIEEKKKFFETIEKAKEKQNLSQNKNFELDEDELEIENEYMSIIKNLENAYERISEAQNGQVISEQEEQDEIDSWIEKELLSLSSNSDTFSEEDEQ